MNTTSSNTFQAAKQNFEETKQLLRDLEAFKPPPEWVLVSSSGDVWKGKPEELLQVLMPYHPLLKPLTLGELTK